MSRRAHSAFCRMWLLLRRAGLFDAAIVESGAYAHFQQYYDTGADASVVSLVTAETKGTAFVPAGTTLSAGVKCGGDKSAQTAQCLRSACPRLFTQSASIACSSYPKRLSRITVNGGIFRWWPTRNLATFCLAYHASLQSPYRDPQFDRDARSGVAIDFRDPTELCLPGMALAPPAAGDSEPDLPDVDGMTPRAPGPTKPDRD